MPTYKYICSFCGLRHKEFQSMKEEPLKKCPECKRDTLERQIGGGSGVIFKGSGFYGTDYKAREGDYSQRAKAESQAIAKEKKIVTK